MKRASQTDPNQRLTDARLQRAWSQQEMADLIDTTRINISRWERGITNPSPYFRQRICALFQKDPAELGFTMSFNQKRTLYYENSANVLSLLEASSYPQRSPCWHLPFLRSPFFTGREETLASIQHIFHESTNGASAQACIISGMGGVGKTQVALEYAFRHLQNYQAVLWIRGEKSDQCIEDVKALVKVLNISESEQQRHANAMQVVQHWLQNHSHWLLLIDDVVDPRILHELYAAAHGGHILLTTTSRATGLPGQQIHLSPMNIDEGALFLLRRARLITPGTGLAHISERQRTLAQYIARLLGGLPLALDQAGSYIEETGCDLAIYLHLYTERSATFLSRRGVITAGHEKSVMATIQQVLDTIAQINPLAIDLLTLCAYLHPDAIPEEIITEGTSVLDTPLREFAIDELAFDTALAHLRRHSLIERNPLKRMLKLHPLLQEALRKNIDEDKKLCWIEHMIKAVRCVFPDDVTSTMPSGRRFFKQAQICKAIIEQENLTFLEARHLLSQIDRYLSDTKNLFYIPEVGGAYHQ